MNPTKHQPSTMHFKSAQIAGMELSPNDMAQINKYALSPLAPEDVFAFKVSMAGNQVDRDYEVFPRATLSKLATLFVGKTVVKDHDHRSDNQIARIYATDLVEGSHMHLTKSGEIFTELIARCYMVKTSTNADLIAEIQAGIRKEVSLGCRIGKAICSVCGTDNVKTYCTHFPGKQYEGETCYFSLEDASDAYELSFVAIPAQQHAGTVKAYGEKPCRETDIDAKSKASSLVKKGEGGLTINPGNKEESPDHCSADKSQVGLASSQLSEIAEKVDEILSLLAKNASISPGNAEKSADLDGNALEELAPEVLDVAKSEDDLPDGCIDPDGTRGLTINPEGVEEKEEGVDREEAAQSADMDDESQAQGSQIEGCESGLTINPEEDDILKEEGGTASSGELADPEGKETIQEEQEVPSEQSEAKEEGDALKEKRAEARLRALELSISLRNHADTKR